LYAIASASAIGDSLSADCVVRSSDVRPVQGEICLLLLGSLCGLV